MEVSLAKLPVSTLKAHLPDVSLSGTSEAKRPGGADGCSTETKSKKVKLEDKPSSSQSYDSSASTLVLPGHEDGGGGGLAAASVQAKAEDMKLEIAKIDSILQGNILGLDKSKRKIRKVINDISKSET